VSIRLRPFRDDELPAFIEYGRADYARQLVEFAGMEQASADAKTDRDWNALFAGGKNLPTSHLYRVEDENGEPVGVLWWSERDIDEGKVAFVYDIVIDEQFRGRGYGREAMLLCEDDVRAHGLSLISLNVFGGNEVARGLYRSLGYAERAVFMSKAL